MLFGKIFIPPLRLTYGSNAPQAALGFGRRRLEVFPVTVVAAAELGCFAGNAALRLLEMRFKISISGDHWEKKPLFSWHFITS